MCNEDKSEKSDVTNNSLPGGMTQERWQALFQWAANPENEADGPTADERAAGWHSCWAFDGLVIHRDPNNLNEESACCECFSAQNPTLTAFDEAALLVPEFLRTSWFCIVERITPFYGGPEEGGWWGEDSTVERSKEFASLREAEEFADKIKEGRVLLDDNIKARERYFKALAASCDWAEARGIDPQDLGEVDGEETWIIKVSRELPISRRGNRYYE